jgi:hypothetical protein
MAYKAQLHEAGDQLLILFVDMKIELQEVK